ncbi:MAG: hypothetical protein Fur0014_17290 [Rubrivivax sp.]
MKNASIETWAWVLLYGGLLVLCLGWFLGAGSAALATGAYVLGSASALAGVLMIWWRSRRKD